MIHAAIEQAQPGDVIVVVPTADSPHGFIGDLISRSSSSRNDYQIEETIRCEK